MGVFRQFPYSNFHEMNMDEIIKIVKQMLEDWAQYYDTWDDWKTQVTNEWAAMQSFINHYFDNLNVQTEINNKITSMVNSGEFGRIVDPYVPPAVAEWLAEHITTPETVVIDDTLSIEGAAADAKATGENINLKTSWIPVNTLSVSLYGTYPIPIYADQYDIIRITCDAPTSGSRINCYYHDGTNSGSKPFSNGVVTTAVFRTPKKLDYITIYVDNNNAATFTVEKYKNTSEITNYYDKTEIQSGYVDNSGNIVSGNYKHSDYIPCTIGDEIYYPGFPYTFGTPQLSLYDANKNYLGHRGSTLVADGMYHSGILWDAIGVAVNFAEVAYCTFNMPDTATDTSYCYINVIPDTSLDYNQIQPDTRMLFNEQQKDYISTSGTNPISGKHIAYNGDSICESRIGGGTSSNGGAYAKMIADLTNGTYDNRGHGGATLASNTPATRQIVNDITNMPADVDLICFEGGINDYWHDVPLGTYTESDYSSAVDTTTICGALESIFRQAKTKWVGKPICFVITHKIKTTVYNNNSAGYNWLNVHEKIVGICKKYAIPYYDAFKDSGLNAYDDVQNTNFLTSNSTGTPDGCHPNALGYEKYYVPQLIALFNSIIPRS